VYQPITSEPTLEYAARVGHIGIFPARTGGVAAHWDRYAARAADHGRMLAPGQGRVLHANVHVGCTTAEALGTVRDGHDEYVKFLSPYGRFKHYRGGDVPFDFRPSVEETAESANMLIGSVAEVADRLGRYADELALGHLILFPDFPGLSREQIDDQLALLATEVLPAIGVDLTVQPNR
jgi:alkanesulfonate monooxygenase SsuD/methylene tetrahydromethanopterin reductase-like flavin-dependent oxidoreductase (luciferase family)